MEQVAPKCRSRSLLQGRPGILTRMDGVGQALEEALRDSQSHPDRLAVADAAFDVARILRTTWHMGMGERGNGPTLLVDKARGDLGLLVLELLSEKPQPPTPMAVNAMYTPPVKFVVVNGEGQVRRPSMPEPDWERWSPSADALDRADFRRIGEVRALTEEEWQERLRESRPRRT
jgi:hypothetical protein